MKKKKSKRTQKYQKLQLTEILENKKKLNLKVKLIKTQKSSLKNADVSK